MWESRENDFTLGLRIPKHTICYTGSPLPWKNRSHLWSGIAPVRMGGALRRVALQEQGGWRWGLRREVWRDQRNVGFP